MSYFDKPIYSDDVIEIGDVVLCAGIKDIPTSDRKAIIEAAKEELKTKELILNLKDILRAPNGGVLIPITINVTADIVNGNGRLFPAQYEKFVNIAKTMSNMATLLEHDNDKHIGKVLKGFRFEAPKNLYLCSMPVLNLGWSQTTRDSEVAVKCILDNKKVFTSLGWYKPETGTGFRCTTCKKNTIRYWQYNNGNSPAKTLTCGECGTEDLKLNFDIAKIKCKKTFVNISTGNLRGVLIGHDDVPMELSIVTIAADGLNSPIIGYVYAKRKDQIDFDSQVSFLDYDDRKNRTYNDSDEISHSFGDNTGRYRHNFSLNDSDESDIDFINLNGQNINIKETNMSDFTDLTSEELKAEIDKRNSVILKHPIVQDATNKLKSKLSEFGKMGGTQVFADSDAIATMDLNTALDNVIAGFGSIVSDLETKMSELQKQIPEGGGEPPAVKSLTELTAKKLELDNLISETNKDIATAVESASNPQNPLTDNDKLILSAMNLNPLTGDGSGGAKKSKVSIVNGKPVMLVLPQTSEQI